MKIVPLHSLIILISSSGIDKTEAIYKKFPEYEILNLKNIKKHIFGDTSRTDINLELYKELYHQVKVKLRFGERVVVDIPYLKRKDRTALANIGNNFGAPVFYVIVNWNKTDQPRDHHDANILQGDGVAEVIDIRREDFRIVTKLPTGNIFSSLKSRNFKGVTAIGDIHAMREALKSAIGWATARNHFIIFLGDTIDYGPKPLECISDIYDVVMAGRGALIYGNHERKIERWIEQDRHGDIKIRIGEGNQVTIDAITRLSKWQRDTFENKFNALMNTARHAYTIQNVLFVHGAASVDMFDSFEFRFKNRSTSDLALFGQLNLKEPLKDGSPNRIYDWVDSIPADKLVIVGHDIRSINKPYIQRNSLGGEVIFLDTGSGKGGNLTSADIRFGAKKLLKVDNFNKH